MTLAGPPGAPGTRKTPVVVLGGSGYVAGEALRLLAGHPGLEVAAVASDSQGGQPVGEAFPHLGGAYRDLRFNGFNDLPERMAEAAATAGAPDVGVISAAPHGASAQRVDALLDAGETAGLALRVVDLSADFRFASADEYTAVYGHPHPAPARVPQFRCALPEHVGHAELVGASPSPLSGAAHVGHPGCFPTSVLLPLVPLVALGWIEPSVQVVAVTGSTGAGRAPSPTTHHPARRSNLFAYNPLAHRHEPEMRALAAAATGVPVEVSFVPQAGPFARGIYATLQARLLRLASAATAVEIAAGLARFYAASPFVEVLPRPPRLQDVVGSNRALLSVAVAGDRLVAFSAIDNLTKGAAGGGIQWLNRLLGLPEESGLTQPGIGWL